MSGRLGVHALNIEFYDGAQAHGGLIRLKLLRALRAGGPDALAERYGELKGEHPTEAFMPFTLDPLGWQLFRGGEQAAGLTLFELTYSEHPDAFISTESLAWAYQLSGDHQRSLALASRWVEDHPEHEGGQTLLDELRRSGN